MNLTYKKATLDDLDILTDTRITVLRAANKLSDDVDMSHVREESYRYYRDALSNDTHVAYLVFDGDDFVSAGGISFFKVMPTFHNPTGQKAYIMNMYTMPEYRGKQIARALLEKCIADCRRLGAGRVWLHSSRDGYHLYKSTGFTKNGSEMELLL